MTHAAGAETPPCTEPVVTPVANCKAAQDGQGTSVIQAAGAETPSCIEPASTPVASYYDKMAADPACARPGIGIALNQRQRAPQDGAEAGHGTSLLRAAGPSIGIALYQRQHAPPDKAEAGHGTSCSARRGPASA